MVATDSAAAAGPTDPPARGDETGPADRRDAKRQPADGSTGDGAAAESPDAAPTRPDEGAADLGDQDRAWWNREIRDVLAEALGTYGNRLSGVVITGDKLHFHAPITGGDSRSGGSASGVVVTQVARRTLDDAHRLHVPPPGFTALLDRVAAAPVLVVRAPRRSGGTTAAHRLLCGDRPVYELRTDRPLGSLPVAELPERAGLLLDGLTASQAAELRAADLQGLVERLGARHCTLIVLLDLETRVADPAVAREASSLARLPAARDVVASHLADALDVTGQVEQVLADLAVAELLDQVEPEQFDVHRLTAFALDLAETARGTIPVAEAIRRFHARSRQGLQAWLDDLVDNQSQFALVLALSVLHGTPYDGVSRATVRLERALHEHLERRFSAPAVTGGGGTDPRLRLSRSARLRAARASVTMATRHTRYGAAELEIAAFLDEDHPAQVLDHVWHEYDLERDALLDWLRAVAEDVDGSVQIRAATAIGFLACRSFDPICRVIVAPWAGSGNRDQRERAVAALALPARHPATAARVVRLVDEWCDNTRAALRMTAARALGSSVGEVVAGGPDERLGELAEGAGWGLSLAIGQSIAELVANAEPGRRRQLLQLLDRWSGEPSSRRQRAAICGFLEASSTLWTVVDDGDVHTPWPSLLRWAAHPAAGHETADETGALIARLWGRALLAPGTDQAVHRVLAAWAAAAEQTPAMRGELVDLLTRAARTPRQARLLAHHAKTWRDSNPPASDTARRLLDMLTRKGPA